MKIIYAAISLVFISAVVGASQQEQQTYNWSQHLTPSEKSNLADAHQRVVLDHHLPWHEDTDPVDEKGCYTTTVVMAPAFPVFKWATDRVTRCEWAV